MGEIQGFVKKMPTSWTTRLATNQTFYNGLRLEHRAMVNATVGRSLMRRTPKYAYELLDDMALNAFSWN